MENVMSARLQTEVSQWDKSAGVPPPAILKNMTDAQLESLFRNVEARDMVAPLREARAARASIKGSQADQKCADAIALQEQWCASLERRELLQHDLKRGKECLDQVRTELASLRSRLEEWPTFERHCGVNPLADYVQEISAKERILEFLPHWIKRREQRLANLNRELEACARQNGLEHML